MIEVTRYADEGTKFPIKRQVGKAHESPHGAADSRRKPL
jgi:hypothetical protein